jgi:osmoprotectant transport system permease protein
MIKLWMYMVNHGQEIGRLTVEHIEMTAIAVGIAILIGVPLGILISYVKKLDKPIIGAANVVQAIPSMALLGLMIPLLGIGQKPAIVMVIIYSLLPIIKNTYIGIADIDPQTIESAKGIGMSRSQILRKVQLPLALPVIMAGVRISAVTAVGLMTMGAFIGASGLGYMIFSGIRTVNNYQILAGAIPACVLALIVDWLMGLVEKLVTPISLQKDFGTDRKVLRRKRKHQKIILITAACLIGAAIVGSAVSSRAASKGQIVIGSKDYTEQLVLCHLYSDYIEAHTDLKCVPKENLGGTQVCYEALKSGKIDMYIDYTGTLYGDILKKSGETDMDRVYQICKEESEAPGHYAAAPMRVQQHLHSVGAAGDGSEIQPAHHWGRGGQIRAAAPRHDAGIFKPQRLPEGPRAAVPGHSLRQAVRHRQLAAVHRDSKPRDRRDRRLRY